MKTAFFSRASPDSLSCITLRIGIFEGAILHDELSLSINILAILLLLYC